MDFEFYSNNRTAPDVNPISLVRYLEFFEEDFGALPIEASPFYPRMINHFHALADQNDVDLVRILPSCLLELAHYSELTIDDSYFAQHIIERSMMVTEHTDFPEIYPVLLNADYDTFRHLGEINLRRLWGEKIPEVVELIRAGVSAIVIRPEVRHISPLIYQYLEENYFNILFSKTLTLNFDQYWGIYEHAFGDPIKEGHVRRRMFGYAGREIELLLINDLEGRYGKTGVDLAEGLKREHKGTAGVYDGKTLRGGLIYAEMNMVLKSRRNSVFYALDPIAQYRYSNPRNHSNGFMDHVLLNLPGVHLPEGHEVLKDLSIMLDIEDFTKLL
jgi:hypothetical protein